jgi:hypothetical protein
MFNTSQRRSALLINAALEGATLIKRTTENIALLDPLKVPANTLIAILESIRVNITILQRNISLILCLGCEIESRRLGQSRQDTIGRDPNITKYTRTMPTTSLDDTLTHGHVI